MLNTKQEVQGKFMKLFSFIGHLTMLEVGMVV